MTDRHAFIRVLGPVEVTVDGEKAPLGGPKQRAVLAMLISRVGQVVTTDEIVDGVWGEEPPGAILASIHTYVSNLRTSISHPIERHGTGYSLDAEPSEVDAAIFEDEIESGRRELIANPTSAAERLRRALGFWRGRAYADVAAFPGLYPEAIRLDDLRLSAVEARIGADLALGRHGAVVGELEALAAEHPLRESLRAKHMLALYREGRQGEALRAFRRTQEYLREELGVDPSEELQELEARILEHDYTLILSKEVINEQVALLFTEIAHSGLLSESDPGEVRDALADHVDLVQTAIDQAGGTVIRSRGDGLVAAFSEASLAARAAVTAQRGLMARGPTSLDFTVRMAIDMGEVERRGGDFFGPPVTRGSRLLSAAHGNQILLSREAQRHLGRDSGTQIKNLGEHRFKGLGTAQEVYQLVVAGLPVDFPPLQTSGTAGDLGLSYGDGISGYELREPIGRGPFATVYRGYQPSVGREVAVKIVKPEFANHPAFVRHFESDARLAASLQHAHLASVYDYWRDADGAYLVTPFMSGGSLAQVPDALPVARVLEIATQVGSALSYAHRQQVLHRDIKPANVLLDGDGNAYLADFGMAARAVEAATGVESTSAGYRAPEDRGGATVDARSDLYSLAAVITGLLTGGQPGSFDLSALGSQLRLALEQGLATQPGDRPESVDGFLDLLLSSPEGTAPARFDREFRNPYKGLAAFEEPDAADFFGRDNEIHRGAVMMADYRLSAVVGASGSGKSSLVLAGLLPALRDGIVPDSETWVSVRAVPGRRPFDELATSLSAVSTESLSDITTELAADDGKGLLRVSKRIGYELNGDLLVVVDQFEELFTLVTSDQLRSSFVTSLVTAAEDPLSRLRVVLTLRADFFHEALSLPLLGPMISVAHLALAPLGTEGIREAIVEPATSAGLELEPGLADRIIADLADQPGGLPLLQFTLDRLASASPVGSITHADYDSLGGVRGALAERAQAAYENLNDDVREIARHIFTRLLNVSDDADDIRRRVRVSEFRSLGWPETDVDTVLDTFGQERLLTFDIDPTTRGATVEVAHEALLREWPTLQGWVESRRESLILQRRFQAASNEWEESGRDADTLLTGARLSQYEEWAVGEDVKLTSAEREFLKASIALRDTEAAARHRLRRRVMGGFAAAAVVATVLAGVALWQRGIAQTEARQEEIHRLAASSTVALGEDPERAILLALEAVDVSRRTGEPVRPEAIAALHQAVQTSRIEMRLGNDVAVAFGSSGDLVTAQHAEPIASGLPPVAALSPDGRFFAERVETDDGVGQIVVWDAMTREEIVRLVPQSASGEPMYVGLSVQWDPSGEKVAAQVIDFTGESSIKLWEVPSGDEVGPSFDTFSNNSSFAFIDEQILAAAHPEGQGVLFYDTDSGEVVDQLETPDFVTQFVAHDRLRNWLVLGSQPSTPIQAWDIESKQLLWSTDLTSSFWPTIHPDTGLVAVGGWDGAIRLLDITNGFVQAVLRGHTAETRGALFSRDGGRLVSRTVGETLVWDLSRAGPRAVGAIDLGSSTPFGLTLSPEGDEVAVLLEGTLVRHDLDTGRPTGDPLTSAMIGLVNQAPVSSDWRLVAALDDEGRGWVYELETLNPVMDLPPCTIPKNFNTTGTAVLVDLLDGCEADESPVARVYSRVLAVPTGEELLDLGEDPLWDIPGGVFNPGGAFEADNYLAVNRKTRVEIYDMRERRLITTLDRSSEDILGMSFDPTGRYLALGGGNNGGWVIDMERAAAGISAEDALVFDDPVDPGGVPAVDINTDGVLATSAFGSLRLWDLATGEQIIQIPVDTVDPVWAVFTPSGQELLYIDQTDSGYALRRFLLDSDELIDLAETRVTRGFTLDECRRYDLREEACPPGSP